jgi:hypothetical protein
MPHSRVDLQRAVLHYTALGDALQKIPQLNASIEPSKKQFGLSGRRTWVKTDEASK